VEGELREEFEEQFAQAKGGDNCAGNLPKGEGEGEMPIERSKSEIRTRVEGEVGQEIRVRVAPHIHSPRHLSLCCN